VSGAAPWRTLAAVSRAVVACERCPRLRRYCLRVAERRRRAFAAEAYWGRPVPGFGDGNAQLLVVGLAPAAHGGNRTGRVFTGDPSGDWLFDALHRCGFASQAHSTARDDGMRLTGCYIAAAVRCAPPQNRPTRREEDRCRGYLAAELALLPRLAVILTLGRFAHDAWLRAAGWWAGLSPRERPRFAHGARSRLPDGRILLASYHPSRRNTNTGLLTRPMWHAVFQRARDAVNEAGA
jgi:uracil-DNA glycosylase family 4